MNARNKYGSVGEVSGNIRALLEQRSEFRGWLSRLDELGSQYRPAVAARVRADYEERLAAVSGELEQHRSSIESSLDERRLVHEEASQRFEEASAEIEELELRYQVGELKESAGEKKREAHVSGLETFAAEVEAAASSVNELEAVLADLDGSGPAASIRPQEESPAADAEPESAGAAESEPVVEEAPAEEAQAVAEEPTKPAKPAKEKEDSSDYLDELEFLESLSLDDADSFDAVSRMLEDEES